jgi:hypothetical protein
MTARWSALLWLDWRLLVNRIRTIARSPRRFVPWVIFLFWLLPSFLTRISFGVRVRDQGELPALGSQLAPLGVLLPGLALLILGLSIWRASLNAPAAFQSPADARFVIGAGLDSRAVFTWLSLRTARRLVTSFALMLIVIQVLYLPWLGLSFSGALSFTLAIASFGAIVFGARLLAFSLQRAMPALPIGAIGLVAGGAGAVAFLAALVQLTGSASVPAEALSVNGLLPPGSLMLAAIGGSFSAELTLLALAVFLTAAGIALAGDCYPELWATSSRAMAIRRAMRTRGGLVGYATAVRERRRAADRRVQSQRGAYVPGGAFTVLWKEWLSVLRGRGGIELQLALLAGALILGALLGHTYAQGSRIAGAVAGVTITLLIFWSWAAGVQLGRDLGNPLWWLSGASLWGRLVVWTFARGLRYGVPLLAFTEAALAATGTYAWAMPAAVLPPILLCWMSQTVGLGVYALLPSRTDYRLAMTLRMLTIYAISVPLVITILPGLLLRNPALLFTMPAGVVVGVIIATIAFASWRIQGNGMVFAQEERQ